MLRKVLVICVLSLLSSLSFADSPGVLTDADMPMVKDALRKAYSPQLCQQDLPGASVQTCDCLRDAMVSNLNTDKLKLCKQEGYDDCVAAEFAASKSALTDKQISDCKALTPAPGPDTVAPTPSAQPAAPDAGKSDQ